MENFSRKRIEEKRDGLKKELQEFTSYAEHRVVALQGAIAVLEDLLKTGEEPLLQEEPSPVQERASMPKRARPRHKALIKAEGA